MYIQAGGVKLSVLSTTGKAAVVAMVRPGEFFGEGALAGQPVRFGSAIAMMPGRVLFVEKEAMVTTTPFTVSSQAGRNNPEGSKVNVFKKNRIVGPSRHPLSFTQDVVDVLQERIERGLTPCTVRTAPPIRAKARTNLPFHCT
jgi:hypothetical protein